MRAYLCKMRNTLGIRCAFWRNPQNKKKNYMDVFVIPLSQISLIL